MDEIMVNGYVNSSGTLSIYNREGFVVSVKEYFSAKNVTLTVQEQFKAFSHNLRKYYFSIVVKHIQRAYLTFGVVKSQSEVDYEMRDRFLYYEELDEETGWFIKTPHTLRHDDTTVNNRMMKQYIDHCIRWTIENLEWAIPYPNEDFDIDDMTESQKRTERVF